MASPIFDQINKWFWNEYVWLPPNTTWADIKRTDKFKYAQFSDLKYGFVVGIVLLVIRFTLESTIFTQIGHYFGLRPKVVKRVQDNSLLEKAFLANGRIEYREIQGLAKQLDWSERKVERWLRQRKKQGKPAALTKFTESMWRLTFYFSAFAYGVWVLWDKPYFWNTKHCWYDYPHQDVTSDIWWYYMIELGFYWSLTFSQFMDIKRKDFAQMFIHHIVTILLLVFSWTCNLYRIGAIVLAVHDFADVPLEGAKLARYIGNQRWADTIFVVFALCWVVSRLGLFPYRVLFSTMYEAPRILEMYPAYYVFNSLLSALQVLHLIWTWMIIRVAIQAFSKGVKDIRSDDETSNGTEVSENETPHRKVNSS